MQFVVSLSVIKTKLSTHSLKMKRKGERPTKFLNASISVKNQNLHQFEQVCYSLFSAATSVFPLKELRRGRPSYEQNPLYHSLKK